MILIPAVVIVTVTVIRSMLQQPSFLIKLFAFVECGVGSVLRSTTDKDLSQKSVTLPGIS
jgi:hypothetical protein